MLSNITSMKVSTLLQPCLMQDRVHRYVVVATLKTPWNCKVFQGYKHLVTTFKILYLLEVH